MTLAVLIIVNSGQIYGHVPGDLSMAEESVSVS